MLAQRFGVRKTKNGLLEREIAVTGVTGVGVVVGYDWLTSVAGRTKVTTPDYVVDYDGKKRAGISAADVEKGTL